MRKRLSGLTRNVLDLERDEVRIELTVDGKQLELVAKGGVLEQIIAALSHSAAVLRDHAQKQGRVRTVSAERVAGAFVQREKLRDVVMLQLLTDKQVPYTFACSLEAAADIAARLNSEIQRDVTTGTA